MSRAGAPVLAGREGVPRPLLEFALRYAARGLRVFPAYECDGDACACGRTRCPSVGKHPRTPRGLLDATADADAVRAWWARWPSANIAIATGAESGLFVLDVDTADGKHGDRTLAELALELGGLGHASSVLTGGGGDHFYFAHPGGAVPPTVNVLGPGLDVRGDGACVIAPPSIHRTGYPYTWNSDGTLIQAPPWLLERVVAREAAPPPARAPERLRLEDHRAMDVLLRECAFVRHAFDDAAHLSYQEWFSLATVLRVFPAGEQLFDEFSRADGKRYRQAEVTRALRSVRGAPRHCTSLGWSCPNLGACSALGVRSPAGLPYKLAKQSGT